MPNNPNKPGSKLPPPPVAALRRSASLSKKGSTAPVKSSQAPSLTIAKPTTSTASGSKPAPTTGGGRWLSFFFDGTGNNLDADYPKSSQLSEREHSNVARLYRAHSPDDPKLGIYRFYIPGVGTYFKDVNDEGNTTTGNAGGAKGEDRLVWAMNAFDRAIAGSKDTINVALFGFSRGAALARAFARRIADRCTSKQGQWYLKTGMRPINLYFMGLFDTVASVGLAAQNSATIDAAVISVRLALLERSTSRDDPASIYSLAPGKQPGADPTPSIADGHMAWGGDMRIPPMAKRCVHMVSAHEIRNAFPLESMLNDKSYPTNSEEIVYPGVHSDVGGGYREGEGARGLAPGGQLSLIPLRHMHLKAIQAGVPLLKEFKSLPLQEDFAYDTASAAAFKVMETRYLHYLKASGNGGVPLGAAILSHMKLYYRWRFRQIALNEQARKAGKKTADETRLQSRMTKWDADASAQKTERDKQYAELRRLRRLAMPGTDEWGNPQQRTAEQQKYHQQAILQEDVYRKACARYDTRPGSVDDLVDNLKMYDEQLLSDAQTLKSISNKGKIPLRPHYQAILDAYVAEFEKKSGLKDPEIIAFFDDYVHDSLAGFATDSTLPSDPRCIYIGGDEELKYAMNSSGSSWASNTA
ncbi:T6SS phospholipase effector Tle1-like catalytic domain-containing protein [Hyalangium versicolor]|uniref:T6SS phospholipase effector Tle1-like catalytic domain-containing protein n=1 Tax=Hyalangium versicolor TaxID=2861190 RepID=UPI001CCCE5BB|nr:DUF2235 domain-containing protein [Hyalangium versicolor]